MLNYTTFHKLAYLSLHFYMAFGYQSLSSLYSKRFLWDLCLENSLVILEWNVLVLLELWHGARSHIKIYLFFGNTTNSHNISIAWIISLWFFCTIHVTIHFSWKRQASAANGSPDLYLSWRFYSSLSIFCMIFHILFAPNTTMVLIAMTVKYRLM